MQHSSNIFERFQMDIRNFLELTDLPVTVFSAKTMHGDKTVVSTWLQGDGNPTVKSMQRVYDFMMKYRK